MTPPPLTEVHVTRGVTESQTGHELHRARFHERHELRGLGLALCGGKRVDGPRIGRCVGKNIFVGGVGIPKTECVPRGRVEACHAVRLEPPGVHQRRAYALYRRSLRAHVRPNGNPTARRRRRRVVMRNSRGAPSADGKSRLPATRERQRITAFPTTAASVFAALCGRRRGGVRHHARRPRGARLRHGV